MLAPAGPCRLCRSDSVPRVLGSTRKRQARAPASRFFHATRPALSVKARKDGGKGDGDVPTSRVGHRPGKKAPVDDRKVIAGFSVGTLALYALIVLYDALKNGVYIDGVDLLNFVD